MKNVIIAILVALLIVAGFMIGARKKANVAYEPWPETEPATITPTTPKPKPVSSASSTPIQTQTNTVVVSQNCSPNDPPSIKILSPNGGQEYNMGQPLTIKWSTCNADNTKIFIEIYHDLTTALPLVDSINGIENDGTETIILSTEQYPNVITGKYELRIMAGGLQSGAVTDSSDGLITIFN